MPLRKIQVFYLKEDQRVSGFRFFNKLGGIIIETSDFEDVGGACYKREIELDEGDRWVGF